MTNLVRLQETNHYRPDQVLDTAKEVHLDDVLVVGTKTDGQLYIRASRMTRERALWLSEALRIHALGPLYKDEVFDETEEEEF